MKRLFILFTLLAVPAWAQTNQNPYNPAGSMTQGYSVAVDPATGAACSSAAPCSIFASSGGGGGVVTETDGGFVNLGHLADTAYAGSGNGTLTAIEKGQYALLNTINTALTTGPVPVVNRDSITPTNISITANTDTTIVAANATRKSLSVVDQTNGSACYMNFSTAASATAGLLLGQGSTVGYAYAWDSGLVPTNAIHLFCTSAASVFVMEGN